MALRARLQRARDKGRRTNLKRLTKLEEEVVVQRILNKSLRGSLPSKALVRDIANRLLRERSGKPAGKN